MSGKHEHDKKMYDKDDTKAQEDELEVETMDGVTITQENVEMKIKNLKNRIPPGVDEVTNFWNMVDKN